MSHNYKTTIIILLALMLSHTLIFIIFNHAIPTGELLRESLGKQLSGERISKYIKFQSDWAWIGYISIGIVMLIRLSLITICIKIGSIVFNYKIKNYVLIFLASEITLICMNITSILWFIHKENNLTLEFINSFTPIALSNLLDLSIVNQIYHYPLRIINLFEISLWFMMAVIISKELKLKFWKSFEFVMSTYGVGLLIWIVFVMFLTVNMS